MRQGRGMPRPWFCGNAKFTGKPRVWLPPKGKAFAAPRNICKNLRKKSQLDILRVDDILLLYEIELLENEQFTIKQCIAKQKSTEKQVIPNV